MCRKEDHAVWRGKRVMFAEQMRQGRAGRLGPCR
jgi:hypothetical protein